MTDCSAGGGAKGGEAGRQRFYGKYRGKVLENVDPLFQGRIMAHVPAIQGSLTNWAMPCTPYAGPDVGFYAIPPIGANVWVEFEGGDPNYPIWAGCFWGETDILHVPEPPPPEVKVFKTEFITMILSDLPAAGGFSLKCLTPAVDVPLTMTFDSTGITILCPEAAIKMTPESIILSVPEAELAMTAESVTVTVPPSVMTMEAEVITLSCPASSVELTAEAIAVEAVTVEVTAVASFTGDVNIEGATGMVGPVAIEGVTNVVGAVAVEGAVDIAGGLAIEGGGTIDGAPIL